MKKFVARWFLRLTGWETEGSRPAARRYVLIAAPHTSNWDLIYMVALSWLLDVRLSWMGMHQLFRWALGIVMRWIGGIPIHRDRRENRVAHMA